MPIFPDITDTLYSLPFKLLQTSSSEPSTRVPSSRHSRLRKAGPGLISTPKTLELANLLTIYWPVQKSAPSSSRTSSTLAFLKRSKLDELTASSLPILVQPEFIRRALLAGKHVLSEKPIAKDVATAQELLQWYGANVDSRKTFWAVGENYRYMTKFLFAAEQVRKMGKVKHFRVNVQNLVKEDNKYYRTSSTIAFCCVYAYILPKETAWRKTPGYQGGFLLDGGVHMTAGLRLILGSEHITALSAQSQLQQAYLPPVDTVDAVVQTGSGATGIISLSWGSPFKDSTFEFACDNGVVTLKGDDVTVDGKAHHVEFDGNGVGPEVADFAKAIVSGSPVEKRQSPEAALADLEILEQMLKSGERQGERVDLQLQV